MIEEYFIVALVMLNLFPVDLIQICPSGPIWNRRANMICKDRLMYHCLFDTNAMNATVGFYVEKCLLPKRYIAKKFVFSGNLDAVDCNISRYTPQPIWSNNTRNSECSFQKSLCNDEGQVTVDIGTTETDRACRCNYREGYKYVMKTKNPCRCFPNDEDCSCYIHRCTNSTQMLSPDYECEAKDVLKFFTCDSIPMEPNQQPDKKTTIEHSITERSQHYYDLRSHHNRRVSFFFILIVIGCATILLGTILKVRKYYGQYTRYRLKSVKSSQTSKLKANPHFYISIPERIFRGDDVCLKCNISDGTSVQKVSWFFTEKDNTTIEIDTEESYKYAKASTDLPSLVVKRVSESDSGIYRCTIVFDNETSVTKSKKLNIPQLILIHDLQVANHYYPPKQLDEIEQAFQGKRRNKLVILEGQHGSGKTQAAHHYCMKGMDKYSVIGKILLSMVVPFKEALENLVEDLKFRINYERAVTIDTVMETLKDCFNQEGRYRFPYLLFIDDIDHDTIKDYSIIFNLLSKLKTVPNLDIILATTDSTFKDQFRDYELIIFNGMNQKEYEKMFNDVKADTCDITNLIAVIGNIPLVVVTAIRFMMTFDLSAKTVLDKFNSSSGPMSLSKAIEGIDEKKFDKMTITSQILPLSFIKNTLGEQEWGVVKLIPFFRYNAISTTVLEACFIHIQRGRTDDTKRRIKAVVKSFIDIPLCHVTNKKPARIKNLSLENKDVDVEEPNKVLTFHKITKDAVDILSNNDIRENNEKHLIFLLKMFCFEIDIDVATDVTVERNLRFVPHARKLLEIIDKLKYDIKSIMKDEKEFCIAYLQCAIGTTFLYERTRIDKAHMYLMKARKTAFRIVESECDFTRDSCIYSNDVAKVLEAHFINYHTESVMKAVVRKAFLERFCREFIFGKHRNHSDIDVIRKETDVQLEVFDTHYLNEADYNVMIKKGLAMTSEKLAKLLFPELMLRILHNNGIALNELTYVKCHQEKNKEFEVLSNACLRECKTSHKLRKAIKGEFPEEYPQLFVCLRNKRTGRLLKRSSEQDSSTFEKDIAFFEKMIHKEKGTPLYFEIGIVKFAGKSDIRHKALCNSILLRFFNQSDDVTRKQLSEKCEFVMQDLCKLIEEMENTSTKYTWLLLPLLYIRFAKIRQLSERTPDIESALSCYEKTLQIEHSRNAFWTRFTFEGLVGKIQCLQHLNRELEALQVIQKAVDELTGKNRNDFITRFESLREKIKYNVKL